MDSLTKIIKFKEKKKFEIKRNYGIDLLRIFSMINIIILHINIYQDLLKLKINNKKFKPLWRLEAMSYFAVDCFGLISGIVGYKKYKFSNLIYIWINTFFYSSFFSLYLYYINRMNFKDMILSFFPLLISQSWYINAYFSLYLLIIFYILFFSFYYIIGFILNAKNKDFIFLKDGYSTHWLIILYIIGGYLGKYIIINKNYKNFKYFIICLLIYIFSAFITSESFFFLNNTRFYNKNILYNYLSPTIISEALSLILMFSKLPINKFAIKIISFFTPFTLNITLLHSRLFQERIITFNWLIKLKSNKYIFIVIYQYGIILYIFLGLIDYLRSIFFKILKIKQFCLFIEDKFSKLMDK
jgi:surface polysaccharide O-acyltransferase-like enzyme